MNCEFCGKERLPIIQEFKGKEYRVGYLQCTCEESKQYFEMQQKEKFESDKRREKEKLERNLENAGIPKRYFEANINNDKLYRTALEHGLYISGTVGAGKTYIACSIAIRAAQNGKSVRFLKAYNISSFDLEDVTKPDLLIIDDLGADNVSEWSTSRMRAVIDDRYGSMKPIIITSNYTKQELAKKLHKTDDYTALAIISRLTEMTKPYEVTGKDRRK